MARITAQTNTEAQNLGIDVVDVKIRRADLPEANSQAIYQRMQTEREREATEIRAEGEQQARRIRAQADRAVTVIVAEANRESEQLRGDGDAERNRIFAAAFGRDPEFFAFYRSMLAYERGLQPENTRMLLSPDSDFFRYLDDPNGGPTPPGGPVPVEAAPAAGSAAPAGSQAPAP
jgi:membrane protease subunit HflC